MHPFRFDGNVRRVWLASRSRPPALQDQSLFSGAVSFSIRIALESSSDGSHNPVHSTSTAL